MLELLDKLLPSVSVAVSKVPGGTVGLATTPNPNVGSTNICYAAVSPAKM